MDILLLCWIISAWAVRAVANLKYAAQGKPPVHVQKALAEAALKGGSGKAPETGERYRLGDYFRDAGREAAEAGRERRELGRQRKKERREFKADQKLIKQRERQAVKAGTSADTTATDVIDVPTPVRGPEVPASGGAPGHRGGTPSETDIGEPADGAAEPGWTAEDDAWAENTLHDLRKRNEANGITDGQPTARLSDPQDRLKRTWTKALTPDIKAGAACNHHWAGLGWYCGEPTVPGTRFCAHHQRPHEPDSTKEAPAEPLAAEVPGAPPLKLHSSAPYEWDQPDEFGRGNPLWKQVVVPITKNVGQPTPNGSNTQENEVTMSIPTGEVTGLQSALQFCKGMEDMATKGHGTTEQSIANLVAHGVTGDTITLLNEALEQLTQVALRFAKAYDACQKQMAVKEAYDAAPDAGSKEFVTGE